MRKFAEAAAVALHRYTHPSYFDSSKRGENFELRQDLGSRHALVKKDALKKVIAAMTLGRDVESLFPDVLKLIQSDDVELKKLVYLYLTNYAKSQPELAILAINSFCKDAADKNATIRALAIRTMSCLPIAQVLDYLCEPLRRALGDSSAYVRKTAALAVAKVFEMSPELGQDSGFLESLQRLLTDPNQMVVANAVAALSDIYGRYPQLDVLCMDSLMVRRLCRALPECTEWGQVFILDALAVLKPETHNDSVEVMEAVLPRLQHANGSVVLSGVKVLLTHLQYLPHGHEMGGVVLKRLEAPLLSLLSGPVETQWVAIGSIKAILARYPTVLPSSSYPAFFCKQSDPLYLRREKLSALELLIDGANADAMMDELFVYTKDLDGDFVGAVFCTITRCALRLEPIVPRVVDLFSELLKAPSPMMVGHMAMALADLLRVYDQQFQHLVPSVCALASLIEDPGAKAALLWIIGEYVEDSCLDWLLDLLSSLELEEVAVQRAFMMACLRLGVRMEAIGSLANQALEKLGECPSSMDLRDQALFYQRVFGGGKLRRMIDGDLQSISAKGLLEGKEEGRVDWDLGSISFITGVSEGELRFQPESLGFEIPEVTGTVKPQAMQQVVNDLLALDL